jgi:hypothetical protein
MTPEAIAAELTDIFRTPTGTMSLQLTQGQCIMAAVQARGLFTNASVGLGKTLVIAVAMAALGGSRPLVLTEASNIPQMTAEFDRYRLHWQIPTQYRLESYESLGPESGATMLDDLQPTALFLDESHKVKAVKDSARARRVDRWRLANPNVPVLALSGSPGDQLATYAHMMIWAVPALASTRGGPIPVDADGRPAGHEFKKFCTRLEEDSAFHDHVWTRIKAAPGVVISEETFTGKPLHIKHTILPTPAEMLPHWERLREFGEAPDGWKLDTGVGEQWQLARCFSNGMYYEHDPRPPKPYLEARKAYFGMCNDLIQDKRAPGGPWDTPGQIAKAILAGRLGGGYRRVYDDWMVMRPTYNPITKTTWLSEAALEYGQAWGTRMSGLAERSRGGSIIWTEQIGVGEQLARMTGWPYYGTGAKNQRGRHISEICKSTSGKIDPIIICSAKSCGTGKNLQHRYSNSLFMSPPPNNDACEQWFGRTHRSQQLMPRVYVELLYGCLEDWCAEQKSEAQARRAQEDLTSDRKILLASHDRASYADGDEDGPAWKRAGRVEVEIT